MKNNKNNSPQEFNDWNDFWKKFERTFNLPNDVILDEVSAKMKDGILAIYVPKLEPVKPEVKKIAIK